MCIIYTCISISYKVYIHLAQVIIVGDATLPYSIYMYIHKIYLYPFSTSTSRFTTSFVYFLGTGVTTYSLHPGTVITDIGRNLPLIKYPIVQTITYPFFWPFVKDATYGAQTQICCAVDEKLERETGKYYQYVN